MKKKEEQEKPVVPNSINGADEGGPHERMSFEEINKEINELREKENVDENERSILEKYTQQGVKHIEKLDRFTLDQLISKIMIGKKDESNNRPIKIFWNFTI